MRAIFLVAFGGAIGAVLRYLAGLSAKAVLGTGWPVGTLAVNIVGSFLLGVLLGEMGRASVSPDMRLLLGTGLCGALTTFSTFSVESLTLLREHDWRLFLANVALNMVLGIGAAWAGATVADSGAFSG